MGDERDMDDPVNIDGEFEDVLKTLLGVDEDEDDTEDE
jgi:hypothetical protein